MPIKVTVKEQNVGAFLQLRCMLITSGKASEEFTTKDYVVNDYATVRLRFEDKPEETIVFSILALTHKQTEHAKVKVKVSCQEVDEAFYSEWICIDEWKLIGRTNNYDSKLGEVFVSLVNINVSASRVVEYLEKLYDDVDFTDFILTADEGSGEGVPVHRAQLALHSDVFRVMLKQEWKETTEGCIKIKGVTLQTLRHLKEYMYLRTLPDNGLESLLLLASVYLIDDLKSECVSKLTLNCKAENWSGLLEFGTDNKIYELIHGLVLVHPTKV